MPIPTDTEIVNWTAALYDPRLGGFDHLIQVSKAAPYIGVKYLDGCDLVVCRGSRTAADWMRDFESEIGRQVAGYPQLGLLPWGFSEHLAETYAATAAVLRFPLSVIWAGHSLGGAECQEMAGAHLLNRGSIARVCAFAPPRPGAPMLFSVLQYADLRLYWNAGDPVPTLPVPLPPFLRWEHMRPFRMLAVPPSPGDIVEPLACHHVALYQRGVAAYEAERP